MKHPTERRIEHLTRSATAGHLHWSIVFRGFGFRIANCFVECQHHAGRLSGRRDRIRLHKSRLPHARLEIVGNVLIEDIHATPNLALSVLLTQLVQDIGRIEAGVLTQLSRDNLESPGHGPNELLVSALDIAGVVAQVLADLHVDGSTTSDDCVVLHRSADDHDSIVQRSLGFLHELFRSSTENDRARLCFGTADEDIESGEIMILTIYV